MGLAMEEKWFCMSMTRRTHDLGSGFLFLISYLLYEDDFRREDAIAEGIFRFCFGMHYAIVIAEEK